MTRSSRVSAAALCLTLFLSGGVLAQSTAAITGVVVDTDGAVIPGADIAVRNTRTGESFNSASSSQGVFTFPAMITGVYSVTVSLQGFRPMGF